MDDTLAGGLIGGGAIFLSGLLIMWFGDRAAAGRFPRNKWAGIRTPSTMKSDEAWEVAHEVGGPWMSRAGLLSATGGLCGILAALLGASEAWVVGFILAGTALMVIMLVAGTVRGARAARRLDRDLP
jgi:uncharacterized membrane protein